MKKPISICTPAYNESDAIDELARRLQAVFATLAERYDFEEGAPTTFTAA